MSPMPDLRPIIASLRAETGAGLVRRLVEPTSPVSVYLGHRSGGRGSSGSCCRSTAA